MAEVIIAFKPARILVPEGGGQVLLVIVSNPAFQRPDEGQGPGPLLQPEAFEDEASIDDGLVFGLQRFGDGEHGRFVGGVVPVLASADHPRRKSRAQWPPPPGRQTARS
jgi:hypothetical protein